MTYDGLGRRVRIVEKNASDTITGDRRFVWDGLSLAEQRAANGTTVTRRYYAQGQMLGSVKAFYSRDHLGSVRQAYAFDIFHPVLFDSFGKMDDSGSLTTIGSLEIGYTGHYYHAKSGLHLGKLKGSGFTLYLFGEADFVRGSDGAKPAQVTK